MGIFLTFLITLFGFYLFRNNKQETSSRILEKNKQKQPTKHEKNRVKKSQYKYNPGQVRKKPRISTESKLDPITWEAYVVCNVCGSEKKGKNSEVVCCK